MIRAKVEEDGKIALDVELKPKAYKSGRSGFYAGVNLVIKGKVYKGKVYKGNVMLYEANK